MWKINTKANRQRLYNANSTVAVNGQRKQSKHICTRFAKIHLQLH